MLRLVDVIVLLPGLTGSILRRNGKDVWAASGGGILNALLSAGDSLQSLKLERDPPDALTLDDGVEVGGLMPTTHIVPGLWKIDGYSETSDALRGVFENVIPGRNYFEFGYDWRRDNRVAAKLLKQHAGEWLKRWRAAPDGNPNGKLILIGHSMGGLVSRYFLEVLEGWRDTRALITFGTPFSGSLNALNFLANGYRKAAGLVDLTGLMRSFTSVYQLLPTYKCVDFGDGQLESVDDPRIGTWLDAAKVSNALAFHREIAAKVAENAKEPDYQQHGYGIYPIVGTHQGTLESARIASGSGGLELLSDYRGEDYEGDGTVPRVSATPPEWSDASRAMFIAEQHASLQCSRPVLDHVEGVLQALHMKKAVERRARVPAAARARLVQLGLEVDDAFEAGEPILVRATPDADAPALRAVLSNARTGATVAEMALGADHSAELPGVKEPGIYRLTVLGDQNVAPVTDVFEVFPRQATRRKTVRSRSPSQRVAIEWSKNISLVPADDASALRDALRTGSDYVVFHELNDTVYAYRPREVPERWLQQRSLEDLLAQIHASPTTFRPDATTPPPAAVEDPPAERVVLRNDRGRPVAVGTRSPVPPPRRARATRGGRGGARPTIRGGDRAAPPPVAPPTEGTAITRYPTIDLGGEVRAAAQVEITVDLALQRDAVTETAGVDLTLPQGWETAEVSVRVSSPDLRFDEGRDEGVIRLLNAHPSIPWTTQARVVDDLGDRSSILVRAFFSYDGRHSGSAKRAFAVAERTQDASADASEPAEASLNRPKVEPGASVVPKLPPIQAPLNRTAGSFGGRQGGELPPLTIAMTCLDADTGKYEWSLSVPSQVRRDCSLPGRLKGATVSLGSDAPKFVAGLFQTIEDRLIPPGHLALFEGLGDLLYQRTPSLFKEAYWAIRDVYADAFPIQIVSDEPYVPWELMRPKRSRSDPAANFLGATHPIGRWFLDHEGLMQPSLADGDVATIAPDYSNRSGVTPLPGAQDESAAIRELLKTRAQPVDGVKEEMLALLQDSGRANFALIHFAGHGESPTEEATFSVLYLEDQDLIALEVRGDGIQLGRNRHPLVLLNACQVARSGLNLGVIGGFAEALMHREFGGLVAPLWAVWDDEAKVVSTRLVEEVVVNRRDFATVVTEIRRDFADRSPTFLSYLYYGDVMARFA